LGPILFASDIPNIFEEISMKARVYVFRLAVKAVVVAAVATAALLPGNAWQAAPVNKPSGAPRYDLNGEWQGKFTVNQADLKIEKVMIQQIGNDMVATKITGDEFVPAGKVTIHGAYTANPFSAQQVCASAGFQNAHWVDVTVTIMDATHLKVANSCGADALWERVGKPTLALDSAILFDLDKYKLKPEAEATLEKIAGFLKDNHPKSHLLIAGYTDDLGSDAHNLVLSRRRAASVASWLAGHDLAAAQLKTMGYGKRNPRYPNTNDEARAHNRRVEIVVTD
jgi:outer membrane protein OmpA-like peptidoglycan-associated protein